MFITDHNSDSKTDVVDSSKKEVGSMEFIRENIQSIANPIVSIIGIIFFCMCVQIQNGDI